MAKRYQVFVRLKPGVLDVQGKAVERGLKDAGLETVQDVRIGKLIELSVELDNAADAEKVVRESCTRLLANTVIENFEILEVA